MGSLYREIFLKSEREINKKISGFESKNAIVAYLKRDLKRELLKSEEEIRAEFDKVQCKNCGKCCRFAVSEFSPEELLKRTQNGDKTAKIFFETFSVYKKDEIPKEFLRENFKKNVSCYFYRCKKVEQKGNKFFCPVYKSRPSICKTFPDTPLEPLPEGCAYAEWKDANEIKALYIRALNEIRKFYLDKLNKD